MAPTAIILLMLNNHGGRVDLADATTNHELGTYGTAIQRNDLIGLTNFHHPKTTFKYHPKRKHHRPPPTTTPPPESTSPSPSAPPPTETVLTETQIAQLWDSVGGNPDEAYVAVCIAEHESSGNTQAISPTDDYGIWQIHDDPAALNPVTCAETAVEMSDDGTNWSPWTTAPDCGV
jgi:hypothetical protein